MSEPTTPTQPEERPEGAAAGRGPTEEEARIADANRSKVDLDEVARHEKEMLEKGANVKGEGQIDPS